jgi:hypothetical protein
MANAPLVEAGWGELVKLICPTTKAENFSLRRWTNLFRISGLQVICPSGKSLVIPEAAQRLSGIHFSSYCCGAMDSGPAPPAQNSFAILSRRRIPE